MISFSLSQIPLYSNILTFFKVLVAISFNNELCIISPAGAESGARYICSYNTFMVVSILNLRLITKLSFAVSKTDSIYHLTSVFSETLYDTHNLSPDRILGFGTRFGCRTSKIRCILFSRSLLYICYHLFGSPTFLQNHRFTNYIFWKLALSLTIGFHISDLLVANSLISLLTDRRSLLLPFFINSF